MDFCERTGKRCYESPTSAQVALAGIRDPRRHRGGHHECKHYRCSYCGRYHITRMADPRLRTKPHAYVPMKRYRYSGDDEE